MLQRNSGGGGRATRVRIRVVGRKTKMKIGEGKADGSKKLAVITRAAFVEQSEHM